MKKVIGIIIIAVICLLGFLGYQGHKHGQEKEIFEEASVYFKEKDYDKSIQLFKEAKEYHNVFTGAFDEELDYYLAEAYVQQEQYKKAVEIYDGFIEKDPSEPRNYILKGYCCMEAEEPDEVIRTYEKAYENTEDGEFLMRLCDVYITTEQYKKALDLIREHKDTEDENTAGQLMFAEIVIYEKQQDYQTAYEKAAAYCSAYPDDEKGRKEMEFLQSRK